MQNTVHAQTFVMLGSARTGSNLLMSLLAGNKTIKVFGELFNLDTMPEALLREVLQAPITYLEGKLKAPQPDSIKVVGFKMFYDHLTKDYFDKVINTSQASERMQEKLKKFNAFIRHSYDFDLLLDKFEQTWRYLKNDTSLKVIHLKRRNKLETFVSLKAAFLTNEWMTMTGRTENKFAFNLDFEESMQYFDYLEKSEIYYDTLFSDHSKVDIWYEDLITDQQKELCRLCDFLEVPHHQPRGAVMKKQIVSPLSEIVQNYDFLKENFQPTKWNQFFN